MGTLNRGLSQTNLYPDIKKNTKIAPPLAALSLPSKEVENIENNTRAWIESSAKRGFDIVVASMGIIVLLPVFAIIALWVKLTSPGPVLFRQERVGKGQVLFTIFKYRTMHVVSEEQGSTVTRNSDPRLTKIGHRLRQFKLDELPQLFNVVRGDMSLVGPRPKLEKHERMQMICKPGITGAATIVFAREQVLLTQVPEESLEEFTINVLNEIKAKIDAEYAQKSSFRSDLGLIIATLAGSRRWKPMTNLNELLQTYGHPSASNVRH